MMLFKIVVPKPLIYNLFEKLIVLQFTVSSFKEKCFSDDCHCHVNFTEEVSQTQREKLK